MDFREFKSRYQEKEVTEYPNSVHTAPYVSVLIQTYRHKIYIGKCLDSILKQKTSFPFEIILGDDESNDGTREICIHYALKFPTRIRLFLHRVENKIEVGGVQTGNFNALFNFFSAKGKYIAFCEGDDIWGDPFKLQKQVDFLQADSTYSFSYHSYNCIDEKGIISQSEKIIQPKRDIEKEDLINVIYHPLLLTICFRNILPGIPTEMAEVINVDTFLISLLGEFGKAKFQEEIKPSLYRRHSAGIWSRRRIRKKYGLKLLLYGKLSTYYKNRGNKKLSHSFSKKRANILQSQIMYDLKKGKIISAGAGIIFYIKEYL